jgi:hypothetical protein
MKVIKNDMLGMQGIKWGVQEIKQKQIGPQKQKGEFGLDAGWVMLLGRVRSWVWAQLDHKLGRVMGSI